MSRYKYRIVEDGDWKFELLPNNSNTQFVGYSSGYRTKEEMLIGLKRFKEFLRNNQPKILYVQGEPLESNRARYYAYFEFSDNGEKFYTRRYYDKKEPADSVERIKDNFEVDIRDDLTSIVKERKA